MFATENAKIFDYEGWCRSNQFSKIVYDNSDNSRKLRSFGTLCEDMSLKVCFRIFENTCMCVIMWILKYSTTRADQDVTYTLKSFMTTTTTTGTWHIVNFMFFLQFYNVDMDGQIKKIEEVLCFKLGLCVILNKQTNK